jgi:hypothetical protein
MDSTQLDALKKRFDFDSWSGTDRLGREVSLRNVVLPKNLLADHKLERLREIDPEDGTRLLRAAFTVPGGSRGLVLVDIRECESRQAAHRVVLELLGNFQAPDVRLLADNAIGDVCFGRGKLTALIFARGNLAVTLRNGGESVVGVDEIARTMDRWIVDQSALPRAR